MIATRLIMYMPPSMIGRLRNTAWRGRGLYARFTLVVTRINGDTRSPTLPAVAVLAPGGKKVLGTILPTPEDVSFGGFIEELKPLFEKGKCEIVVSKKVQKVIDDEAKRLAAQQKRAGK